MMRNAVIVCSTLFSFADAHGRLLEPLTRVGHRSYENDPVGGGVSSDDFACRHAQPRDSGTVVSAGGTVDVKYVNSAAHVGDCAFYISYDTDAQRKEMKWFKIANIPHCIKHNSETFALKLPDWLPAGKATLRWDWYALHVSSHNPEMYAQCSDVTINAGTRPLAIDDIGPKYKASEIYTSATNAFPFRHGFGGAGVVGAAGYWFSGPPCANGFDENDCACTAPSTGGRGGVCGGAPPSPSPSSPSLPTLPSPAPSPAPSPNTDGPCRPLNDWGNLPNMADWCISNGCPSTYCTQPPTSSPTPSSPSPSPAPSPSPTRSPSPLPPSSPTPLPPPSAGPTPDEVKAKLHEVIDVLSELAASLNQPGRIRRH